MTIKKKPKNTLTINLFGPPCSGKSVMASFIFAELKVLGIECELISEYAKQLVFEEAHTKLTNQIYIMGKQHKKHIILNGKMDVVVTDSPLPLGFYYDFGRTKFLKELIMSEFNKWNNLNIFLTNDGIYNPVGRLQTVTEAQQARLEIMQLLTDNDIPYIDMKTSTDNVKVIVELIKKELAKNGNTY